MRIGLPIMDLEVGGAEWDVINLSAGLKKAGHEPFIITSGGALWQEAEGLGISLIRFPLVARTPWRLWRNGRRLARLIEEYHLDILNPQCVFPSISGRFATRRLLRKGRAVPNIVTVPMMTRLTPFWYWVGTRIINRVADHLILESDCERVRLELCGLNCPTTVLYNCFPPERVTAVRKTRQEVRREMGWPDGTVVFLLPARMHRQKAHEVLLEALARPEIRPLKVLAYLAGDGPLLDEQQALAKRLGVEDKVVFAGFRRDVPALMRGADVFLLCSRQESLPLSVREGMTAGLPTVATRVGGVPETVEDGESGLLVPKEDPEALAKAMARLAADADRRQAMGRRAAEIVHEKFNYDRWIERTVALYERVRNEVAGRAQ